MKKLFLAAFIFCSLYAVLKDKEKDPLHKRKFITNIIEIKNSIPSNKTISDEMEFKDGKIFSDFLNDKFNMSWIKYSIEKDTTFIDSVLETEVRYFEVKAYFKDEDREETNVFCKINNEYIEGEIKISKNDKLKKHFEFSGSEKATKIKDKNK